MSDLKSDHRHNEISIPAAMDDHPVSHILSMFWDGGDVWGSAMAEGFALCDYLAGHLGASELIPEEMGYRMSMGGADTDDPIYALLVERADLFTAEQAAEYLMILHHFIEECVALGLDY